MNRIGRIPWLIAVLCACAFPLPRITVPPGDLEALKGHLAVRSERILVLSGDFRVDEELLIDGKSGLTLECAGAKFHTGDAFRFTVRNSARVTIKDLAIRDDSDSGSRETVFDFRGCRNSGLKAIDYSATSPKRRFAWFRTGSKKCFVSDCKIKNVSSGIWLGDNGDHGSPHVEPNGVPTSDCIVEGNRISGFVTHGIATRSRMKLRSNAWNPAMPDSRLGHVIRGNEIDAPNIDGTYSRNVGIESWGSGNTIAGNTITANPADSSMIGISIALSYRTQCVGNTVSGAFWYMGIELATSNNSAVTRNTVTGVASEDYNSAAIGVSTASRFDPTSRDNLISSNRIADCKKGVNVAGDGFSEGTRIEKNEFLRMGRYAIFSTGAFYTARGNVFDGNRVCIYNVGGETVSDPIRIIGNDFRNTRSAVFLNENRSGNGRPFLFENNTVNGWGDAEYPEALVMRCGPSVVRGNTFKRDGRAEDGFPIGMVAVTKSFGYGQVRHVFAGNTLVGVPLSIPDIVGDRVGVNLRNYKDFYHNYDLAEIKNGRSEILPMAGPPLSQAWKAGDRVKVANPEKGGYREYECVVPGTPGTWKGVP